MTAKDRVNYYGYLFRHLKSRYFYYRCLNFVTNFAVALQTAVADRFNNFVVCCSFLPFLTDSLPLRLFVPGVFFLVNVVLAGTLRPFLSKWRNTVQVTIGVGQVKLLGFFPLRLLF